MRYPLPTNFDDRGAMAFCQSLPELATEPDLILDFTQVRWVYPFGTLLIAHGIKHLAALRRRAGLITQVIGHKVDMGAVSYLKFFGFFRYVGVAEGQDVNEAPGGSRYLPITIVNRAGLAPQPPGAVFQDAIERDCDRLAKVIFSRPAEESASVMLSYCFRELVRNSLEHARVSSCSLMAQRWDNGNAEVVIADHGVGVFASLREAHAVAAPEDALALALKPGISSGAHRATGSKWDNTGFGLYVASELGRQFGSFTLVSSERALDTRSMGEPMRVVPVPGTIVKLRIATQDAEYWPNILTNIVARGEEEAALIPGAIKTASGASKRSHTWDG